jgi:hypothetical protein
MTEFEIMLLLAAEQPIHNIFGFLAPLAGAIFGGGAATAVAAGAGIATFASKVIGANNQRKQAQKQQIAENNAAATQNKNSKNAAINATNDAKTPHITDYSANLGALRKAAKKNGFNPIAVLRAGGLSAFSTVTQRGRDIKFLPTGDVSPAYVPKPSVAAAVLGSIGTELGNFNQARIGIQTHNANLAQSAATIANMQANTRYTKIQTAGYAKAATQQQTSGVQTNYTGGIDHRKATNPWPKWSNITPDDNLADAQLWSDRYGELVEWVAGVGTLAVDVVQNIGPITAAPRAASRSAIRKIIAFENNAGQSFGDYFKRSKQQANIDRVFDDRYPKGGDQISTMRGY